jgi:DNA relaxase NicK
MHWRASRVVTDWTSLRAEVRKWQVVASLAWSEDDVLDVASYLNDSIYHFELMNSTSSSTKVYEERCTLPDRARAISEGSVAHLLVSCSTGPASSLPFVRSPAS